MTMYHIQKAEIKDFLEIAELDRTVWSDNRNSFFIPDGEHIWRIWVEYSLVFKACIDDKIVGATVAFLIKNDKLYFLHKMFVQKEYRDKKVGSMMFEKLCHQLDSENAGCLLTVDPTNKRMLKLCRLHNFSEKNYIKSYYRDNEDRFLIGRNFKLTHHGT